MKILLCCHLPLNPALGGAKVYIENARSYKELGVDVKLVGLEDVLPGGDEMTLNERIAQYPSKLLIYLENIVEEFDFDILEFESLYFPKKRPEKFKNKIFVARSVLLEHHFLEVKIPYFKTIRSIFGKILKGKSRKKEQQKKVSINNLAMSFADYINVPNFDDQKILVRSGFDKSKIIVSPYGIFNDRLRELSKTTVGKSMPPVISFVGTFDPRKGAVEFPEIIKFVKKEYPDVIFRLIGTSAMFPDEKSIRDYFPKELSENIEVYPRFIPSDLPKLISGTHLGIFPSHMESFGFGILEMVTAGIPVVAYDVPGPNMILPKEFLVAPGNVEEISLKLISLIKEDYEIVYSKLKEIPRKFSWPQINSEVVELYEKAFERSRR